MSEHVEAFRRLRSTALSVAVKSDLYAMYLEDVQETPSIAMDKLEQGIKDAAEVE
jgi:hypothetical protein